MDKLDVNQQLDKAKQAVGSLSGDLWKYAVVAIVVLVILYAVTRLLKKKPAVHSAENLQIDVMALGQPGPARGRAGAQVVRCPVRLALVVMAPAGRVRELPPLNRMEDAYEALLPGLAQVVAAHRPVIRRWPPQVSSNGFAHVFLQMRVCPGREARAHPGPPRRVSQDRRATDDGGNGLLLRTSIQPRPANHGFRRQVVGNPAG